MSKLTITVVFFLACLCASFALAQTATPHPNLAAADWSVSATHSLRDNPPSKQAVWFFINKLGNPFLNASDLTPGNGKLCSFRFVDLRHSGQLSLVAVDDGGGTTDCNGLTVFDKTSAGIETYDYSGALVSTDTNVVMDINGDGHFAN